MELTFKTTCQYFLLKWHLNQWTPKNRLDWSKICLMPQALWIFKEHLLLVTKALAIIELRVWRRAEVNRLAKINYWRLNYRERLWWSSISSNSLYKGIQNSLREGVKVSNNLSKQAKSTMVSSISKVISRISNRTTNSKMCLMLFNNNKAINSLSHS